MKNKVKVRGIIKMFVFGTEEGGFYFYPSMKEAKKDRALLLEAGANYITEIEKVNLTIDDFQIEGAL